MRELTARAARGESLTRAEAFTAMTRATSGAVTPEDVGAWVLALKAKGESPDEITGFVEAIHAQRVPVPSPGRDLIDVCGTGGDGLGTFNVSTTVSFVVAGAGLAVAKHGNRSVSSRSGSADVLEALGVPLDLTPERASRALAEVGFVFLFAPRYHPVLSKVAAIRRALGVRTVFNLLGPLLNPAPVTRQLMGVYATELLPTVAEVLAKLGRSSALVVCGEDGLDELSLVAATRAVHLDAGRTQSLRISPSDLKLSLCTPGDLRGGEAAENAQILVAILKGELNGPKRDVTLLNAGAALWAGARASSLTEGFEQARAALDSGAAWRVLEKARGFR